MAVVTESFLPHVNGVTRSVIQVLRHLVAHGHEAHVLTPGDPPGDCEGARVTGLPSVGLPGYPQVRVSLASAARLARELEALRPDVVHLASPFVLGGPVVRAAGRLGIPVVAVYQTDVPGYAAQYTRLGHAPVTSALWRRVVSIHERADVTLAPTATVARQLSAHGVPRVLVWPRGVDVAAFHPSHRHRDPADGVVRVGFVGRLAAEKRIADLAAVADLPGVELVVVGDGPEREELRRVLPTARFTGLLGGAALSRETAGLDVAVQTGPHETFCQAAQEAMASGVPVVAAGAGGLLDLVDSSRTGWLYPPGDTAVLRERVADLVGDRRKREAMGAAAYDAVRGRTWESVCGRLVDHYRAVRAVRLRTA
ncbi:glycosyltransferase family 1 protein [Lapillicoccus jejuensis]|uniref:D-inositol 3-phosphate glycosyltransferase n=1 Tax=Lapillicoccus jejuensis TaxID=402171 RepID=A0A542E0B1_9MICO|nr:phosphatidylinositol alpha 1,6-mannosyltransferase [Lapillicoccus jejuensis]